jgi:hypothetical protein
VPTVYRSALLSEVVSANTLFKHDVAAPAVTIVTIQRFVRGGTGEGFAKFERGGMAGLSCGLGVGPRGKCSKKLPNRNGGKFANAEAAGRACTA